MFLSPLYAEACRNHTAVAKNIMVDDTIGDSINMRATEMGRFAMFNDHAEILDIALDSWWHKGSTTPDDIQEMRYLALCLTGNPETFKRMLLEMKPSFIVTHFYKCH
jgi:hypothetical protein